MELKNFFVMVIIVGIFMTGLISFINPFITNYGVDDENMNDLSPYNPNYRSLNESSEYINKLQGLDRDTKITELSGLVLFGSFYVFIDGLKSLPILGDVLINLSKALGIDTVYVMGIISLITISIVFVLAKLLISVVSKLT